MIIAVDLDETLCEKIDFLHYEDAVPIPYAIQKVNLAYRKGYVIYIYSARWEEDREKTALWLLENNVLYNKLILGKLKADLYIDNHSRTVETWDV